jgi:hypothetical protein
VAAAGLLQPATQPLLLAAYIATPQPTNVFAILWTTTGTVRLGMASAVAAAARHTTTAASCSDQPVRCLHVMIWPCVIGHVLCVLDVSLCMCPLLCSCLLRFLCISFL